ncbi:hypothetical protein FN846DRAFT_971360 [Sphaerosporella brunnea]|uniref:Prokaryotic-type class I peptide chain release factors domain-containing protein n=1 Tax=Sphaerosporella brunnea TaxID=1250544 RepID=A0A5J5EIK1_9PEZI|nr:hypothetical protein FN846DRAFT_971360 [Sphaerosporella brunnea]
MSLLFRLRSSGSSSRTPLLSATTRAFADWRHDIASKWSSQEEIEEARHWVETFKVDDIPKKHIVITYSASSGPGGQNVNKLSTKATLHLSLKTASEFLPGFVVKKVRENSRHLTKDDEIVLQADESRKQSENMQAAFHRLHQILVSSVAADVPGVTSAEQKQRVAQLQKQEAQQRRKLKSIQKDKKQSRRSRGDDY